MWWRWEGEVWWRWGGVAEVGRGAVVEVGRGGVVEVRRGRVVNGMAGFVVWRSGPSAPASTAKKRGYMGSEAGRGMGRRKEMIIAAAIALRCVNT